MGSIFAANVTTAVAWASFFFALTHVDPAICNAIHSTMGPLTVVALGAHGITLAKPGTVGRVEYAGYAGMAVSVAALWWVVIGGYSSLTGTIPTQAIVGLALLSVSGIRVSGFHATPDDGSYFLIEQRHDERTNLPLKGRCAFAMA